MKRENRYLILKHEDIKKYLPQEGRNTLLDMATTIALGRADDGKEVFKNYVVVAEDWPMYEATWDAIEEWVDKSG
jgi:hypothetical protein